MAINATAARNPYTELVAARLAAKSAAAATPNAAAANPIFNPIPQPSFAKSFASVKAAYTQQDQSETSTAAAVVHTGAKQDSAQQQPEAEARKVSSILDTSDDEETNAPNKEQILSLARRYVKAIGKGGNDPRAVEKEAGKVADFYAASPERASRFESLVVGLEDGAKSESSAGAGAQAVAVA